MTAGFDPTLGIDLKSMQRFVDTASKAHAAAFSPDALRGMEEAMQSFVIDIDPQVVERFRASARSAVKSHVDPATAAGLQSVIDDAARQWTVDPQVMAAFRELVEASEAFSIDPSQTVALQDLARRAFRQGTGEGRDEPPSDDDEVLRAQLKQRLLAVAGWFVGSAQQAMRLAAAATDKADKFNSTFATWNQLGRNLLTIAAYAYVIAHLL